MKLRIMEWNIKGAAALPWRKDDPYELKSEIADKVVESDADVFVLSEFVISKGWDYFQYRLKEKQYIWFVTCETGKNGILTGIKKKHINEKKLIKDVYENQVISSLNKGCDVLRLKLPLATGEPLTVIGCRMKTGSKSDLNSEYDHRRDVFDKELMPEIPGSENICIAAGDFNNARCLGDLNKSFRSDDYAGKAHLNYNLNIIKDRFDSYGFKMADIIIGDEIAKPVMTHINKDGHEYPDDHIFVKGLEPEKCETIKMTDLSDHYILLATAEMKQ